MFPEESDVSIVVSHKASKPEGKSSSANMAGLGNRGGLMLHVENKTLHSTCVLPGH